MAEVTTGARFPDPRATRARSGRRRSERQAVQKRIIIDDFGSIGADEVKEPLRKAGCDVRSFRPLGETRTTERNHRKLFIIDGKVAITGGVGIYKTWLGNGRATGQWRDSNAIVTGPAVAQMQQAFAENWQEEDGPLLPPEDFPEPDASGPSRAAFVASTGSGTLTRAERLMQLTIASAKKRLWIANPYFIPSPGLIELLTQKRQEGVDVRVMVASDETDHKDTLLEQRRLYSQLIAGRIRIWEYQPSLIHAKTLLVDDHLAVVGSINFDRMSLDKLEEGSLVMSDPALNQQLEEVWHEDVKYSVEIRQ